MRIRQWLVFMLLPFLLCACAGQEAVEEPLVVLGDTYVKDGIRQNTHVYMENVYYENGVVYYTIVNQRSVGFEYRSMPYIERWNGEEWMPSSLFYSGQIVFLRTNFLSSYSRRDCSRAVDTGTVIAGEYRLIYGSLTSSSRDENGNYRHVYSPDYSYVIGYLSIPETPDTPAERAKALEFEAELVEIDGGVHLHFTLENKTTEPLEVPLKQYEPSLERYRKTENGGWFEQTDLDFHYTEDTRLASGQVLELTLPVYAGKYELEPITALEKGRYCVSIFCRGAYSNKEYYAAVYFDYPTLAEEGGEGA